MNIKSLCCVVLILAFLMYYQTNPVFTIVIVVVGLGVYIFYKSRISGSGSGLSRFLSGKDHYQQDRNIDDLVTLVMLQQLISSSSKEKVDTNHDRVQKTTQKEELELIQKEVLELLD